MRRPVETTTFKLILMALKALLTSISIKLKKFKSLLIIIIRLQVILYYIGGRSDQLSQSSQRWLLIYSQHQPQAITANELLVKLVIF